MDRTLARAGPRHRLLALLLALAALAFLLRALWIIWELKIPGLFGDQWQIFDNYLRFPFPENLFVNQNNHLLIFPSLIFLLDIHAFDGNQWFPQLCGMLLTVTFVSSLAYLAFTDRTLPQLSRSAGFAACTLLIYWMATSRTLLHSNEIVCVFLVLSAAMLAFVVLDGASRPPKSGPAQLLSAVGAGLLCLVAVFSFGAGIASFAAAILIAVMLRMTLPAISVLGVMFLLTLGGYLAWMGQETSAQLIGESNPLVVVRNWLAWIGSPIVYLATGATTPEVVNSDAVLTVMHIVAPTIGGVGIVVAGSWAIRDLWRAESTRLSVGAWGLVFLSAAAGFLVAYSRSSFFELFPLLGVLSPRYLVWSTLFWLGLTLLVLTAVARIPRWQTWTATFSIVACVCLAIAVTRSETKWLTYMAIYTERAGTCLLAIRLGIHHPIVPDNCGVWPTGELRRAFYQTLEIVQRRNLGQFNTSYDHLLGADIGSLYDPVEDPAISGSLLVNRTFRDLNTRLSIAEVSGWSADEGRGVVPELVLIIDGADRVRGIAEPMMIDPAMARERHLSRLARIGFRGFVLDFDPAQQYRLTAVQHDLATPLGKLKLEKPKKVTDAAS